MTNSMKILAAAALSLLTACGGSGNAALSKSFNYGAASTPTTTETAAATSAQDSLSQTSGFSTAPDATKGAAIIGFADELAAAALGNTGVAIAVPREQLTHALRTATDFSTCAVTAGNTVTFNNCQQAESGFTVTLNGHVTASAGIVSWSITGGFSGTDSTSGMVVNISLHQDGALNITSSKITGDATSDFSGTVSGQGQNVSFGLATAVVIDLNYQTTPSYCVTSGTAEVKRVWTNRPSGATGLTDAGVKFTWTGCGAVQVAHST